MDVSELITQEAEKIAQTQDEIIWIVVHYMGLNVTVEGARRTLEDAKKLADSIASGRKRRLKWEQELTKSGTVYVATAKDGVNWALIASVLA